MGWKRHFRTLLGTACALLTVCYAFILVIDPYQNVPFSPAFARAPIDTNQRFSYPPLARRADFDSAIFGTSTTRLIEPSELNRMLDARFANFSMNGATAWEQTQLFQLFNRHHPEAHYLIFGIDVVWCEIGEQFEKYTFRLFPHWMYDEDPWNDLPYLLNDKALENAVRELEYLLGRREAKYGLDGYRSFLPGDSVWNLQRAREKIYRGQDLHRIRSTPVPEVLPSLTKPQWNFPTHVLMKQNLDAAPRDAEKVLLFVPYHEQYLRHHGKRMSECKGRLTELASHYRHSHVLDFMIPSEISRHDENYWDVLHFKAETAKELEQLIVEALRERRDLPDYYRYLNVQRIVRR